MTEQLLNRSQIGPAVEQVSCRSVPQAVGRQTAVGDCGGGSIDDRAGCPLIEAATPTTQEQRLGRGRRLPGRPAVP
jgi:hypothetical protein